MSKTMRERAEERLCEKLMLSADRLTGGMRDVVLLMADFGSLVERETLKEAAKIADQYISGDNQTQLLTAGLIASRIRSRMDYKREKPRN